MEMTGQHIQKPASVCLLGSSSGRNAGDAALLAGIMQDLDKAVKRPVVYEIPTVNCSYIRNNYRHHVRPVSLMPWFLTIRMLGIPTYRAIMRSDLILIFDAVLFDRKLLNPLFNFMSSLYFLLPLARRHGKKMGMYNVGIGPISTKLGAAMLTKLVSLMDFITLRDEDSITLLRELGIPHDKLLLGADAALSAPAWDKSQVDDWLRKAGVDSGQEFLAINVNVYLDSWAGQGQRRLSRQRFIDDYAEALSMVAPVIHVPLVFVCTQHMDVELSRAIMDQAKEVSKKALVSNRNLNHEAIKGILGRASLLCGMRLHSLILAAAMNTPIVGIEYQPKVRFFMSQVGLDTYCLSFSHFSPQHLADHIIQGWQHRRAIQRRLQESIPGLLTRAQRAASCASQVIATL